MSGEVDPGASQDLAEQCEELKNGKKSVMSHVATEQRRRDRINEGCAFSAEATAHNCFSLPHQGNYFSLLVPYQAPD